MTDMGLVSALPTLLMCSLFITAVLTGIIPIRIRFRKRKPEEKPKDSFAFTNRLKWMNVNGDLVTMTAFQADCFYFQFQDLTGEKCTEFINYMSRFSMKMERHTMMLYCWLVQNRVKFTLKWHWNKDLSIRYNIKRRHCARDLKAKLDPLYTQIMLMDLEEFAQLYGGDE